MKTYTVASWVDWLANMKVGGKFEGKRNGDKIELEHGEVIELMARYDVMLRVVQGNDYLFIDYKGKRFTQR